MSVSAISPVESTPAPLPTPAAESVYLIDTYGAVATSTGLAPPGPIVISHAQPLVTPAAPISGAAGTKIDVYA